MGVLDGTDIRLELRAHIDTCMSSCVQYWVMGVTGTPSKCNHGTFSCTHRQPDPLTAYQVISEGVQRAP